jgi:glycosyltransferase involved in cell wall biosynthesis
MPQISIVIPVYNAQKTLSACLHSIFNQTFKNYEIIVVNDGSTDKSLAILKKFQSKITVINQKNQGAAKARNEGAKVSKAPFIIFCDADVTMKPKMLEIMYKTLQANPNISYVYSDFKFGLKTFKLWKFSSEILKEKPYIHTTSLIRRKHFLGFDKNLKRFQDWDLWLNMLKHGYTGYHIPEVLFIVRPGGTMSRWLPKSFYRLPWLKSVKQYQQAKSIIKNKHRL